MFTNNVNIINENISCKIFLLVNHTALKMQMMNIRRVLLLSISLNVATSEIIEGDIAVRHSDSISGSENVRDALFTRNRKRWEVGVT